LQINDGLMHRVLFTVSGTTATLTVDAKRVMVQLAGIPASCAVVSTGCRVYVGARAMAAATTGATLYLTGTLSELTVFLDTALFVAPGSEEVTTSTMAPMVSSVAPATTTVAPATTTTVADLLVGVDLLAASRTTVMGNAMRTAAGGVTLGGAGRLALTESLLLTTSFVFNVSFTQAAGSSGYLFGKFDETGTKRYISLYTTPTLAQVYYRTTAGSNRLMSFSAELADGQPHVVALYVSGRNVALEVDGRLVGTSVIGGDLADCGMMASTCVFFVGQRTPSNVGFTGTITRATYTVV
jgi:hypothetical protein